MIWYLLIVLNNAALFADGGGVNSQLVPMKNEAECVERMKELDASAMKFKMSYTVEVRAICIKGEKR